MSQLGQARPTQPVLPTGRCLFRPESELVAALSGFCLIGYVGAAFLGLGDAYVLSSIVVAVIGGMSLAGGRGSYMGVAAAAILVTVLTSLLATMQIGEAGRQIVFGCILVVFLLVNRHLDRAR